MQTFTDFSDTLIVFLPQHSKIQLGFILRKDARELSLPFALGLIVRFLGWDGVTSE